ncbi:gp080 [Erwinia phage vB_Eam-MM7]|uniref:Gp080 n=1 Tax=Erwinia phage vB_Eam-MM7 TaxID=1051674 RepID=G0YPR2_9CAUD|nr:gp080 [Erwinia phage vB_Eam-MM7]AEJ81339.1 gp080 [Erwinia phage vB_Eam-MM7]
MNKPENTTENITETSTPHVVQISSNGRVWFEYLDEMRERTYLEFESESSARRGLRIYCNSLAG